MAVAGLVAPDEVMLTDPPLDDRRLRLVAEDLRAVAVRAAAAMGPVGAVSPDWQGEARDAYEGWQAGFDDSLVDLVGAVGRASAALDVCADEVAAARAVTEDCRERMRTLRVRVESGWPDVMGSSGLPGVTSVEIEAVRACWERAYWSAVQAEERAAAAVGEALAMVPDRPRGPGEHIGGALTGLWQSAVAEPAVGVWALTGDAAVDRDRWEDTVASAVDEWARAAGDPWSAVTDAGREAVAWDHLSAGAYGHAAGSVAAGFVPGRWVGRAVDPPGPPVGDVVGNGHRRHVGREYSGPGGTQTLAEMLDLVDLTAHEDLGHTLQRHVDVTDEDLTARVTTGLDFGDGPQVTATASRFIDRDTAELAVTRALNARQSKVLAWLSGSGTTTSVTVDLREVVGVSVRSAAPSTFVPSTRVTVVLYRDANGRPYVLTAYPEVKK